MELPTRTFTSVLTLFLPAYMASTLFSSLSSPPLPKSLLVPQLLPSPITTPYLISLMSYAMFIHHLILSDCFIATETVYGGYCVKTLQQNMTMSPAFFDNVMVFGTIMLVNKLP